MCETFERILLRHGEFVLPCPFCGSPAELWQRENDLGNANKAVCCTNAGNDNDDGECLMYLAGETSWRATRGEAIQKWNTRNGVHQKALDPHNDWS